MYPQNYYPIQNYPRQEVVRVTGQAGANAYQLPPNSSALLLDNDKPVVYLVQSDGAGYKTISAYGITINKEETQITLEERVSRLEAQLEQSNTSSVKRKTNAKQDDE